METIKLRTKLTDEISRIVFDARISYITDKRLLSFYQLIKKTEDAYTFREVDEFIEDKKADYLLIWGNSDQAQYSYQVLKDSHYNVIGLVTNSISERSFEGFPLYSVENVPAVSGKGGIIVFQKDADNVTLSILEAYEVLTLPNHVVGRSGNQYFDFFQPHGTEFFLDGGSLDGMSTRKFIEWCHGDYGAVYAFEPNPLMAANCKKYLERIVPSDKLFFHECALWNCKEKLRFDNSGSKWNAHVGEKGQVSVSADCIDSLLREKTVTFIKLDIEGSEMQTLLGAKDCIQRNHPRMAISVYHHDYDIVYIMDFLLKICPDYRFALRHYHSDSIETVLYAF